MNRSERELNALEDLCDTLHKEVADLEKERRELQEKVADLEREDREPQRNSTAATRPTPTSAWLCRVVQRTR